MIDIGEIVLKLVVPILEILAPAVPGEIFPYFFTMEMLQRSLVAALLVTFVSGFLGVFLLIRNLALIGDGSSPCFVWWSCIIDCIWHRV